MIWILILLPLYDGEVPTRLPYIVFPTRDACERLARVLILERPYECRATIRATQEA